MKKIQFDKVVSIITDVKEDKTEVIINGFKLLFEDGVLKEEVDKLTVKEAQAIEAKYTPVVDEQGKKMYTNEDMEAIQKEVATYKVKEEVALFIGDKIGETNAIKIVEDVLELSN